MKILLDECLPRKLKYQLPNHEVMTVPEKEWAGVINGRLLSLAEVEFDIFITIDSNLRHQQSFQGRNLAVIILQAAQNTYERLLPLMPKVEELLKTIQKGQVEIVR